MNREVAFKLLRKYLKDQANINHSLESEAIMRYLAKRFSENEEEWGIIGLLHDIDWELTQNNPPQHCVTAVEILKTAGIEQKIIDVIVSHSYGTECAGNQDKVRTKKIEYCLAAAETLTGLIFACALVHPDKKLSNVKSSSIRKKMKDKSFAAKVNRNIIMECEKAGISIDEFIDLGLKAMQEISHTIGL